MKRVENNNKYDSTIVSGPKEQQIKELVEILKDTVKRHQKSRESYIHGYTSAFEDVISILNDLEGYLKIHRRIQKLLKKQNETNK